MQIVDDGHIILSDITIANSVSEHHFSNCMPRWFTLAISIIVVKVLSLSKNEETENKRQSK